MNIIQEHLYLDMYEGVARNKQQIDATSGAMIGEAARTGWWIDKNDLNITTVPSYLGLY